ncbi:WD40 repeat-like protein [Gonapodya prolifera JEL478]|uniref:WD40 repeat-like protein n=1 Tax=Gonapodya prolifera (strain JEL478) TaxID=1344416 RepID=A0A139ADL8_GONPJ|nr:WD40 repeat-like protein [Gonapodya prolifera JEL478]|eukprot:KXS14891.1 WD40 repeat-like protein [Gonapodya prolifera JEL478]
MNGLDRPRRSSLRATPSGPPSARLASLAEEFPPETRLNGNDQPTRGSSGDLKQTHPPLPSLVESSLERAKETVAMVEPVALQTDAASISRTNQITSAVSLTVSPPDTTTGTTVSLMATGAAVSSSAVSHVERDLSGGSGAGGNGFAESSPGALRKFAPVSLVAGGSANPAKSPAYPTGRRSSRVNFALPQSDSSNSTTSPSSSGTQQKNAGSNTGTAQPPKQALKVRAASPKSVSMPSEMNRRPSLVALTRDKAAAKGKDSNVPTWSKSPASMRAGHQGATSTANRPSESSNSSLRQRSGGGHLSSSPTNSTPASPTSSTIVPQLSQDDQDFSLSYRFCQRFPHMSINARRRALTLVLRQCDPLDFVFITDQLPKLHRDFLGSLPIQLSHKILTYVHPRDLCTVSSASRKHCEIVKDNELWRALYAAIGLQAMAELYHVPSDVKRKAVSAHLELDPRSFQASSGPWDVSSGKLGKEFKGHEEAVFCCQQDDKKVVSGGGDGLLKVWSVLSGEEVFSVKAHGGAVNCLKYTGTILVTGGADKTIKIWQFPPPPSSSTTLSSKKSPSPPTAGAASVNVGSPTCLRTLHGHTAGVKCIDFTHVLLVSGSGDGVVRVWQLSSGNLLHTFEPTIPGIPSSSPTNSSSDASPPFHSPISSIRLSPTRLVIATLSGNIYLYNVAPIPPKISAPGFPQSAVFETLRKWLQLEGGMKPAGVWDLFEGKRLTKKRDGEEDSDDEDNATFLKRPVKMVRVRVDDVDEQVESSRHSETTPAEPDSPKVAVPGSDTINLSTTRTTSPQQSRKRRPVTSMSTWALCVSADEWRFMAGGSDGTVKIWNHKLGTVISSLALIPVKSPSVLGFGSTAMTNDALGRNSDEFESFDEQSQETPPTPKAVTGVAFDDAHIVVASTDGILRIWETDTE